MFDWLVDLLGEQWWTYALLFGLVVFDSVLPVLPSETGLITTGVIAGRGDLAVTGLIAAGWAGAVVGDNLAYTLGDRPGRRVRRWLLRRDSTKRRVAWTRQQMEVRPWIVAVARFIPGGRTAATLSAGSLDMPRARFLLYVVPGGLLWSTMNVMLGYAGGLVFRQNFWLPLVVSFLIAGLLAGGAELASRRGLLGRSPEEIGDEELEQLEREMLEQSERRASG